MSQLYDVFLEVRPLPSADFPSDSIGAYVHVYVPASCAELAVAEASRYLRQDNFDVLDFESVTPVNPEAWEEDDEDLPSQEEMEKLAFAGGYLYGAFHCYAGPVEH